MYRLRKLFEQDQIRYREMLMETETSQESRISTMRKRMHELREARERDRKAVVEAKLEQQWR